MRNGKSSTNITKWLGGFKKVIFNNNVHEAFALIKVTLHNDRVNLFECQQPKIAEDFDIAINNEELITITINN